VRSLDGGPMFALDNRRTTPSAQRRRSYLSRRAVAQMSLIVGLLGSACGGLGGSPSEPASQHAPSARTHASPTAGVATLSPVRPAYPNLGRFSEPLDRFAYKYAFGECNIGTPERLAGVFGGDPSKLASVARAYASSSNPGNRQAAFLGCLDGLRLIRNS
jgi:hypothetical protein